MNDSSHGTDGATGLAPLLFGQQFQYHERGDCHLFGVKYSPLVELGHNVTLSGYVSAGRCT
jgi:hypothetical protein